MVKKIYNLARINCTNKHELSELIYLISTSIVYMSYILIFKDYAFLVPIKRSRSPPFNLSKIHKNLRKVERKMKTINLRKLYPLYYTEDYYIEVSDEVAEQIKSADRVEHAYTERIRYHKAYYSLDAGDGIEKDAVFISKTPQEIYERKLSNEDLSAAINKLPDKQAKRIYARYFQNMSLTDIARVEHVDVAAVKRSIDRALKCIAKILKNF